MKRSSLLGSAVLALSIIGQAATAAPCSRAILTAASAKQAEMLGEEIAISTLSLV